MKRKLLSILTVGILFSAVPVSASSFAEDCSTERKVEYVALGDSIPAGMTPYGAYDLSYPDYLKSRFENSYYQLVDYDNFSVAGYLSEQLKNDILYNENIRQEIKEASHITITIGANDMFQKLISDPSTAYEGIATASTNLQDILSMIDELNSDVDVYVMGYYNPFSYYPEQVQEFLVPLINTLNSEIEMRAKANGDHYVPTGKYIDSNYQKYMPNPEDNHLNTKGYKVIAREFWKAIQKNYKNSGR